MAVFISFRQINISFELIIEIEPTSLSAIKIKIKCFIFHHLAISKIFRLNFWLHLSCCWTEKEIFRFNSILFLLWMPFCVFYMTPDRWKQLINTKCESQQIYFSSKFCFCFLFSLELIALDPGQTFAFNWNRYANRCSVYRVKRTRRYSLK